MAKRRWKREWLQAVESYYQRILQRLQQDENFAITQYKSLYFVIFKEAYKGGFCAPLSYELHFVNERGGYQKKWLSVRPVINGTSILQYAKDNGWIPAGMEVSKRRHQQIKTVQTWWDEWTYAWHKLGYKTRCHRTFFTSESG